MTQESLSLTLFFAIAAVAMIGAVNARGTIRVVLSYVLAVVCLGLAVFQTYKYMARETATMDVLTTPSGAPDLSPSADTDGTAEARAAHNLMSAQGQDPNSVNPDQGQGSNQVSSQPSNQGPTNADLRKIMRDARRLQNNLAAINLAGVGQMSDADYARLQSNAHQYSSEAQNLQTRMATLAASPPVGQEDALQGLTAAIGYLVSGSRDLEHFFNSESTADEKMHAAGFRNGTQAAGASLQKVESRMGAAETSAP